MTAAKDIRKQELAVIQAAKNWWRGHRPLSYDEQDHLDNPLVNCCVAGQDKLAQAVAYLVEAEDCVYNPVVSRTCERGTDGCTVKHEHHPECPETEDYEGHPAGPSSY